MRSPLIRGALAVLLLGIVLAAATLLLSRGPDLPELRTPSVRGPSPDPVSWREPEADLRRFFPGANGHREELRILSHERLTLRRRLGREPLPEEHLAVIHRALRDGSPVGVVMVRRVGGAGGAIEVVVAISPDRTVRGVRLQRQREPAPVAKAVDSPQWLGAFKGRSAESGWSVEHGALAVSATAREPAAAIAQAVRSSLVMFETAEGKGIPTGSHH